MEEWRTETTKESMGGDVSGEEGRGQTIGGFLETSESGWEERLRL